jgi:PTH1 family peptidyl-tRNA hydrolase
MGELRVDFVQTEPTHAGIESMKKGLKKDTFAKVRIGVGSPEEGENMNHYLLKDFTPDEHLDLIDVLNRAESVIMMLLTHSVKDVQNKFNPEGAPKEIKRRVAIIRK